MNEVLIPHPCTLVHPWICQNLDYIRDGHDWVFYLWYIWPMVLLGYGTPRQLMQFVSFVVSECHCLNNSPLTIMHMTTFNTIWLSHLLVDDTYKFMNCGESLSITIKEKNIQFTIQGQLLSIYYPAQYTNGIWYGEYHRIHCAIAIDKYYCHFIRRAF